MDSIFSVPSTENILSIAANPIHSKIRSVAILQPGDANYSKLIASSSCYIAMTCDDITYQNYYNRLVSHYFTVTVRMLWWDQRYRIVKWLYSAMYGCRVVVLSMVSNLWYVYSIYYHCLTLCYIVRRLPVRSNTKDNHTDYREESYNSTVAFSRFTLSLL